MMFINEGQVPPGGGFIYIHSSGNEFQKHYVSGLRDMVMKFHQANQLPYSEEEFVENVCKNTKGSPCSDQMRGAGDLVAMIANPIARAIDAVAGTNVAGCGGCRQRQEKLNEKLPFK